MIEFADTHCHIHEILRANDEFVHNKWADAGVNDAQVVIDEAVQAGVNRLLCVGTSLEDSRLAVDFVQKRSNCWASIGIHPHEAKLYVNQSNKLQKFCNLLEKNQKSVLINKIVAIGECGLDYYYQHSSKKDQQQILRFQIELAQKHDLPLIFHIREAFEDFWSIFDSYKGLRGVVHSFSSTMSDLDQVLSRGLYVGLNGIVTFTKNPEQQLATKAIPLPNLLLETDAPFLTPAPYRGTICSPKHVSVTAEFLAGLRDETMATIAHKTTQNACHLFGMG